MMARYAFVIVFLISLSSCKEVSFKEPQPKGKKSLTHIPDNLCGKYALLNDEGKIEDTLDVFPTGYKMGHNPNDTGQLSDSIILKHYKGYYYLNINQKPEWLLRVIQPLKNGDINFLAMEQTDGTFSDYLERLSSEIEIDSITTKDETLYQIDPKPKQLAGLIKKGFFKKTLLKRIK